MSCRIRFPYDSGASLVFAVERIADGQLYDFTPTVLAFVAAPHKPTAGLPEAARPWQGLYSVTMRNTPPAIWADGAYSIRVLDARALAAGLPAVVASLSAFMHNGDDQPVYTPSGGPIGA